MKIIEHETSLILKEIVHREATALQLKDEFEKADFICLEKLCKAHQILSTDVRESIKAGLFGKLTDEDLEAIASQQTQDT
jgi:hypothetical protein